MTRRKDTRLSAPIRSLADLKIEIRSIDSLTPRRTNPRTHSEKQIRQIAKSIQTFGYLNPILTDASGTIIAGHARFRALKLLGFKTVPTVKVDHLTETQIRKYVIADNRHAENAHWDDDLLKVELRYLAEIDLDFDPEVIGFETPEVDFLIEGGSAIDQADPADTLALADPDTRVVTRPGDLWQAGPHRLLCGDALDDASYARLLDGNRAAMVFTDPPYNDPIAGHVSGKGRHRHAEFAMASGEMSAVEFITFLEKALARHALHSQDGSLHYVCMDWRHSVELMTASRTAYNACLNQCVWVKTNAGMGSFYRSQHELVFVFKVGTAPHVNNVELGRHGRSRTNVWRYAGANVFGRDRDQALAMHPTVKPVRLVADAILDASRRGDIVLDGFAGSGTTLLAAERSGRIGYGLELEPRYVDVALRRLAEQAGLEAILASTGQTFDQVAQQRAKEAQEHASTADQSKKTREVSRGR